MAFNKKAVLITFFYLIFIALMVLRGEYVESYIFKYTDEEHVGFSRVLLNDSLVLLVGSCLLYCSYSKRLSFYSALFFRLLALVVLIVYILDFLLIINFASHLNLFDVVKYYSYSFDYLTQFDSSLVSAGILLITLVIIIALYLIYDRAQLEYRYQHQLFILSFVGLGSASLFGHFKDDKYIHSWMYKNVLAHNVTLFSEHRSYSDKFIEDFEYQEIVTCSDKAFTQPQNIVVLMVESLSNYQSNYFSGINNWTPHLDQIAKENTAFVNFHANGFTTEDAEISLLTGQLPIYQPASYSNGGGRSFYGFFNLESALPFLLKQANYKTEFITTADLSFSKTGEWATSIGFEHIEGHEQPYYDSWPRMHFHAAPDEALYQRLLDRINREPNDKVFYFVKTVSTHHPFVHPHTKVKSEEGIFRYADEKLGYLYQQLQQRNFFDDGILIIVGDHHAMLPLKASEIELYGEGKAGAMIPLIIVTNEKSASKVEMPYQQLDVYNAIKHLLTNQTCHSDWSGDVLQAYSPKYIAHRRGDIRNKVSVITENEVHFVRLDGDHTRLEEPYAIEAEEVNAIISKINAVRIERKQEK